MIGCNETEENGIHQESKESFFGGKGVLEVKYSQ